ncbi:MAG TPA: bis-aminopropyl spermidine synthase family protein [Actinospica sp.]|jgi:hypothetical protein|nr:bis-aminopropyl spermidine synthase family protein [Actinospica sp.]
MRRQDTAATLSLALAGDPGAGPARIARVLRRARRGGRIDDVIRGELSLTSGIWLLARLLGSGLADVAANGRLVPRDPVDPGEYPDVGALIDARAADALIDWSMLESLRERRGFVADSAYFQAGDTLTSLRRRMALMDAHDDLDGRTILQLGDDNMFGVALGLVPGVRHVHVADIDVRLLADIDAAASLGLPVTTHEVDVLRSVVPVDDVDTFFVSNLKDAAGLLACVAVAVAATDAPGAAGYVSFAVDAYRAGYDDRQVMHAVLQMFAKLDCVPTDIVPCDEPALDDAQLADLAAVVREAAQADLSPARVGERLRELGREPRWLVQTYRHGFPDVSILRPALLARVVTGGDGKARAARLLRMLHRRDALTRRA